MPQKIEHYSTVRSHGGAEDTFPFEPDHIAYFRSDLDGTIRYVDDTFSKLSDHSVSDLIGVAHRDMIDASTPDVIAQLAWDRAIGGQATVSYLHYKTRTESMFSGLTFLLPLASSCIFLSVPPKTQDCLKAEEIFDTLAPRNEDPNNAPLGALTSAFRRCDYPGYDGFMLCALVNELSVLTIWDNDESPWPGALSAMSGPLRDGMAGQAKLIRSFGALQLIPNNMRIIATRMEPIGGPISAIAENYKVASTMITQRLYDFVGSDDRAVGDGPKTEGFCEHLIRHVTQAIILLGCIFSLRYLRLQGPKTQTAGLSNSPHLMQTATGDGDYVRQVLRARSWSAECQVLADAEFDLCRALQQEVGRARAAMTRLTRTNMEIRRLMLGLDTMRVLGRVECCRRMDAAELATTIDHLDQFHTAIRSQLESVTHMTEAMDAMMQELDSFAGQILNTKMIAQNALDTVPLMDIYSDSIARRTDLASELVQSASPMTRATS